MPRLSRDQLLYDGCYAHIISRSIREMPILRDEEDFMSFLRMLEIVKQQYAFKIYHYCLMNTHFHLAVHIPNVSAFSSAVRKLKTSYIRFFHTKYRLSGPLWRERYKSLLIENDPYLFVCGEYIENNPVKAGMVKGVVDWPYSSARYYIKGVDDRLVDCYDRGAPYRLKGVDVADEDFFEKGHGVGSSFFRFKLRESLAGRLVVE